MIAQMHARNRFDSLAVLLVTVFMLGVSSNIAHADNGTSDRPNILFVFADDWGRQAGAYAKTFPGGLSDVVETPNFDQIAKRGILFTQAFVSAPSCTPCRSSLFSGRNFWETGRGAILRGAVWDSRIPTFPLVMKDAGYHIGFSSKAWSPGTPRDEPFGGRKNQFNKHGGRFNGFSQFVNQQSRDRQELQSADVQDAKSKLVNEVHLNFRDFLGKRADDQPFLYFWGPTNVHRKWIAGSGKKFWGIEPDELKGKVPPFMPDVPAIREDLADYLGEIQAVDLGIGQLMKDLEAEGLLKNTVIIISGDHGAAGFPNGKCSLYDFGTAVPLLVRLPEDQFGNRVVDDLVSLADLGPTILELCGLEIPKVMTGRSMVRTLQSTAAGIVDDTRTFVVTGRERHVAEARSGNLPYPQRAIRTQDFLLIHNFKPDRWPMGNGPESDQPLPSFEKLRENTRAAWADFDASPAKAWIAHNCRTPERQKYYEFAFGKRPEWELYSVKDDPHQIHNLAGDEEHDELRQQLAEKLMDYLQKHSDPRVTGDQMTFEQPPFTNGPAKSK